MAKPPCCDKNGLKRGPWTAEEDQKLIDYIQKHGHGRWRTLPKNAGLKRCGKSCRLRWTNYLRPDIKRGKFSIEEEETIIQLHSVLGNKWSAIASRLPGRTDNEIKNYWNTHIKKKLLRMGIDPVTHSPRLDLLELSSLLSSSLYNSTQLNNPSGLLAIGSMLNPNFLNLATTLLSNQNKTINEIGPTNVQQPNHTAGNSTTNFQYDHQSFQISENPTNLSCQNSTSITNLPNLWQEYERDNNVGISTSKGFVPMQNYSYHDLDQSNINSSLPFVGNYQACFQAENNSIQSLGSFGSLISAPSSSSTPLNSSSTTTNYVNNNGSSNTTTEDVERDSYCSNMLMFDHVPNGLNFNGCL